MSRFRLLFPIISLALGAEFCTQEGTGNGMTPTGLRGIDEEAARTLRSQRIFFAHQSIGANILDGIGELRFANGESLRIMRAEPGELSSGPGFYETLIGRNGDPRGKIDDFVRLLDAGIGRTADIAILEICYADIDEGTDVGALFAYYDSALAAASSRNPGVRIVHITVPLEGPPVGPVSGVRELAKKILGRQRLGVMRNMRREAFNDLLRTRFEEKAPFFDLAGIESVRPNGERAAQRLDGRSVPCLAGEYTADGGHLNERGRREVAERLLGVLVTLQPQRPDESRSE